MAGTGFPFGSPQADLGRPDQRIEGQLTGVTSYSHCRPVAAAHGRRLPGELRIIAAILDQRFIEKILTHLGLRVAHRRAGLPEGLQLQAA
jgi:hypothetical protein